MAGWLRRQFRKVIQWEETDGDILVWKYPLADREEIMKKSRLVVREGQAAMLIVQGKLCDVYQPGEYDLSELKNIPILTSLMKWKYAWESPYTGDVFFINTRQFSDLKWGTTNPVMMSDKQFGMIRLRGFGVYSFRAGNYERMLTDLFGTRHMYRASEISKYFKKIIVSKISDTIAESKVSALELASNYTELSEATLKRVAEDFDKFGIEITSFYIENLSLPEEVEKTIDKRTQVGVMNGSMKGYAEMQAVEAMRDAAQSGMGGLAGAGIGLGAGVGIGKLFGDAFGSARSEEEKAVCRKCGAAIPKDVKFCPECGTSVNETVKCAECGAEVDADCKFCPECGKPIGKSDVCPKCGEIAEGAKFCPKCGTKID